MQPRMKLADLVPTSQELAAVMGILGRKKKAKNIQSAVDAAVKQGKVRPQAAKLMPTLVTYAQDRIEGVSQGTMVSTGTKPLDERYFEGTREQLKGARTKQRLGARGEFFESSIMPELQRPISEFFAMPEGKKYVMTALRSRMKSGRAPADIRKKDVIKELEKDVGRVKKAEAAEDVAFQGSMPRMKIKESGKGALTAWRSYADSGFYAPKSGERSDVSMAIPRDVAPRKQMVPDRRLVAEEKQMFFSLREGMTRPERKRFEKLVGKARAKYADLPEDAYDRLALAKMYPNYQRFLEDYGSNLPAGKEAIKTQEPGPIEKRKAERARISSGRQMKATLSRWRDLEKTVQTRRGRKALEKMRMEWDPSALAGGLD
jgi:hypothetical protein